MHDNDHDHDNNNDKIMRAVGVWEGPGMKDVMDQVFGPNVLSLLTTPHTDGNQDELAAAGG
jgi:hypothetical protein